MLEAVGGLHKFNGWDRPILTDSGGFQVFSLTGIRKMKEEGVTFQSHIDGSRHLFTPERVMDIERSIGADIMMAFDECTPGTADYRYAKQSMERTHRWLDRCVQRFSETEPKYGYEQALFPIVQGCVYRDLREQSAEYIASKDAWGNAIGGLAVGEPTEKMYEMIELVNAILPKDKPRYLMGVGTPANILEGFERVLFQFVEGSVECDLHGLGKLDKSAGESSVDGTLIGQKSYYDGMCAKTAALFHLSEHQFYLVGAVYKSAIPGTDEHMGA